MAKPTPRASVELKDFPGMVDSVAGEDVPEGATEVQVNLVCTKMGEISTRRGYRVVTFED